ncbi:NADH pyrophosphatase [Desulfocucumis palustris]|uniref:NAD(+) diphosphatase n=1 Tax=Desulfocucumis palustris TaxID=1898651 RepID=A0A2L2XCB1_9FIRM|nr:NAD(+) diphosphatase [Desulfocucumis palustris]GBF33323.1 NADH pyrophosphatase [Desulfocucumis palustris]
MLWFLFYDNKLLIKINNDTLSIPGREDLTALEIQLRREIYIGRLYDSPCFAAEFSGEPLSLPGGFDYLSLRELLNKSEDDIFRVAGRGYQIINWARKHQFCGKCGGPTKNKPDELAKECTVCGTVSFPRISPAVIVAIVKEDKLLLARNIKFPSSFYSVLAGFVEPGETLEECVQREVKEEVGIEVKNIKYFGSQSWPFPDSLMIAFTAEYAGGEIAVDNMELSHADWFSSRNMPAKIPDKKTIAGRLIEWFLEQKNF